jgi:hypothetical protein
MTTKGKPVTCEWAKKQAGHMRGEAGYEEAAVAKADIVLRVGGFVRF